MILIIGVCKEKLHHYEFTKPIEDIVKGWEEYSINHYLNLTQNDIRNADKIIICGTSLRDEAYLKQLSRFSFLKDTKKPVLGICAGMQIISLVFNGKLRKQTEIGMTMVKFKKEFLGLTGEQEVYSLHNYCTLPPRDFEIFAESGCIQAIKHKKREIYGVLFHPEVRQKGLIERFIKK